MIHASSDERVHAGTMSPTITPDQAFWHVADAYRWLAACVCSWERLKPQPASTSEKRTLDQLVPNVDVAIQAGALVYARKLIEFYRHDGYPRDIKADDHFGVDLESAGNADLAYLLETVKPAIDAHLAHLSELREPSHPERSEKERLDWNREITDIADRLVGLLETTVNHQPPPCCVAGFRLLLDATRKRRSNRRFPWPDALIHPDARTGAGRPASTG